MFNETPTKHTPERADPPAAAGLWRALRSGRVVRTSVLAAGLSVLPACGVGAAVKPPAPTLGGTVRAGGTRPLLVDWGPNDRTVLNTSRRAGPLVVRFHNGTLEPLFNCHAKGSYVYSAEHSMQVQDDIIENVDELHAKMPAFGARFEAQLASAGKLHVRMRVVGMYTADQPYFRQQDLTGDCRGATNVASHVTVGAFRLFALSKGDLRGDIALPAGGGSLGGQAQATEQNLNEAGDEGACSKASGEDKQPPEGCTTSLQLVLAPIDGSPVTPYDDSVEPASAPAAGWVVGAVGLTGLAAGGVLLGLGQDKRGDCAGDGGCPDQASLDRYDAGTTLVNASVAAFVLGGAGVATGAGILLFGGDDGPNTASREVRVWAGPGAIRLGGTF